MAHRKPTGSTITTGTGPAQLTPADDLVYTLRYLIAAAVAAVTVVMSYQALADLNARGGIADQWRWVWPVIVEGPHLAGALAVVIAQRRQQDAAWSWFLLGAATAASVAANVAAAPPDTLSRVLHGVVPIVGMIQIKDLCIGIRKRLDQVAAVPDFYDPPPMPAVPPPTWGATSLPAIITVPVYEPAALAPAPAPNRAATPRRTRPKKTARKEPPVPAEYVETARAILAQNPKASGEDIGEVIGTGGSYGRRVKRAALA